VSILYLPKLTNQLATVADAAPVARNSGVVRSPQVAGSASRRQISITWLPLTAKLKHLKSLTTDNVMKHDVG
jgi:hypothetical protein